MLSLVEGTVRFTRDLPQVNEVNPRRKFAHQDTRSLSDLAPYEPTQNVSPFPVTSQPLRISRASAAVETTRGRPKRGNGDRRDEFPVSDMAWAALTHAAESVSSSVRRSCSLPLILSAGTRGSPSPLSSVERQY